MSFPPRTRVSVNRLDENDSDTEDVTWEDNFPSVERVQRQSAPYEPEFYRVNAVADTPRLKVARRGDSTVQLRTPKTGSLRDEQSSSKNPGYPTKLGGCFAQAMNNVCAFYKSGDRCEKGSHKPDDLKATWMILMEKYCHADVAPPKMKDAIGAILRRQSSIVALSEDSQEWKSVEGAIFNLSGADALPDDQKEQSVVEDQTVLTQIDEDFSYLLGEDDEHAEVFAALETELNIFSVAPIMSRVGRIVVEGKRLPPMEVLLDTGCEPASIFPLSSYEEHKDVLEPYHRDTVMKAKLADQSVVTLDGALVLDLEIDNGEKTYTNKIMLRLMEMKKSQIILSVKDILRSYYSLYKEVVEEAKILVDSGIFSSDPVVESMRPEEWPPPSVT